MIFFSAVAINGYFIIAVGNLSSSDFSTYNLTIPVYFLNYDLTVFKPYQEHAFLKITGIGFIPIKPIIRYFNEDFLH